LISGAACVMCTSDV
jgi:hypothetical protein